MNRWKQTCYRLLFCTSLLFGCKDIIREAEDSRDGISGNTTREDIIDALTHNGDLVPLNIDIETGSPRTPFYVHRQYLEKVRTRMENNLCVLVYVGVKEQRIHYKRCIQTESQ